jgi:hypothetical protein
VALGGIWYEVLLLISRQVGSDMRVNWEGRCDNDLRLVALVDHDEVAGVAFVGSALRIQT